MYNVIISKRAQEEFVESVKWYNERSTIAAENFKQSLKNVAKLIASNPRSYPKPTRNYHEKHLEKYPFTIVYGINEDKKEVVIVSIFHQNRNPKDKYK